MARNFVKASGERISLTLAAGASLTGAITIAAICRKATDFVTNAGQAVAIGQTNTVARILAVTATTNLINFRSANATSASTSTFTAADGWALIAATKAAGVSTPRLHIYKYATRTWTHENGTAAIGDSTPDIASWIGTNGVGVANWDGDIAVGGAWSTAMTDAQVETLAGSLTPWFSYSPNGLWVLDQADVATKVVDLTGNGANQATITGTTPSTVAVPVWSRGGRIITVTKAAAASTPVSDGDTTSVSESEAVAASVADGDSTTIAEVEQVAAALTDTDATTISETEAVAFLSSDGDVTTITDGQSVVVFVSDTDGTTISESESIGAAITDGDLFALIDSEAVSIPVSDGDTFTVVDAGSVVTVAPTILSTGPSSISDRPRGADLRANPNRGSSSISDRPTGTISSTEEP